MAKLIKNSLKAVKAYFPDCVDAICKKTGIKKADAQRAINDFNPERERDRVFYYEFSTYLMAISKSMEADSYRIADMIEADNPKRRPVDRPFGVSVTIWLNKIRGAKENALKGIEALKKELEDLKNQPPRFNPDGTLHLISKEDLLPQRMGPTPEHDLFYSECPYLEKE